MFHEEDGDERRRENDHPPHSSIDTYRLKYFLLFSVDNVEKDEFVLQKDKNWALKT
ncbi:MAG: hypothetical protein ABSB28_04705 [Candidatus Bathyarchaeia archaeon]